MPQADRLPHDHHEGPATADNLMRWDGQRRGHYEVWYLTCNHRESQTGYWIRYTLESPLAEVGEPYAQLWFAAFDARDPSRNLAFNRRLPIEQLSAGEHPFELRLGEALLSHGSMRGALDDRARWDLRWTPAERTHRHLPSVMYRRGGLGETTVLTPNLDVAIDGVIDWGGRRVELRGEPGGQTHLWGRKHAYSWAWGHCNAFEGRPGAAFESLSVRLRRRGRVLPMLTIFTLYLDGEAYRFNQFRHTLLTRARYGTAHYRFSATGPSARIEGEYSCRPEDMVVAEYHDPDGEPSWCSNTEVADLRVTVFRRGGLGRFREHARLVAPRTGHFEVGGRERDAAIAADHITL
jgi:hypothetical protein